MGHPGEMRKQPLKSPSVGLNSFWHLPLRKAAGAFVLSYGKGVRVGDPWSVGLGHELPVHGRWCRSP